MERSYQLAVLVALVAAIVLYLQGNEHSKQLEAHLTAANAQAAAFEELREHSAQLQNVLERVLKSSPEEPPKAKEISVRILNARARPIRVFWDVSHAFAETQDTSKLELVLELEPGSESETLATFEGHSFYFAEGDKLLPYRFLVQADSETFAVESAWDAEVAEVAESAEVAEVEGGADDGATEPPAA